MLFSTSVLLWLLLIQQKRAAAACTQSCSVGSCVDENFENCAITCGDMATINTCEGSTFTESEVSCDDGRSCESSEFFNSTVSCNDVIACNGAVFHASSVTCNPSACVGALFLECTCCDGAGCPDETPSCTENPFQFCSDTFLGLTCKEFQNPACDEEDVAPSGVPGLVRCDSGDCVEENFATKSVLCDNKNSEDDEPRTCQSAAFSNSLVACDGGACLDALIEDSTAQCYGKSSTPRSCDDITVRRSTIVCPDTNCWNADFHASAVTCEDGAGCFSTFWDDCSCCQGDCGDNAVPDCSTMDLLSFCSSTSLLGKNCKAWGNPLCENITPTTTSRQVTSCLPGECSGQTFTNAAVYCDNKKNSATIVTCASATMKSCDVICDSAACPSSTFEDSTVSCQGYREGRTCDDSVFDRSTVACNYGTSCSGANFRASAVVCDKTVPLSAPACSGAIFDDCSCCDGSDCPSFVPSCLSDVEEFCAKEVEGLTCTDLGNPVCPQVSAAPSPSPIMSPTFSPTESPTFPPTVAPTKSPSFPSTVAPTKSPTSFPTPAPAIAPAPESKEPVPALPWCFSKRSEVEVLGQGTTRMDALKIGDDVLAADGTFSKVYSFGHHEPLRTTKFLQIWTNTSVHQPLEITDDHLLYVHMDKKTTKMLPASKVEVGDCLVTPEGLLAAIVTAITTIERKGLYSPFTAAGNLVVNGVAASSYIALPTPIRDVTSFEQQHWLQHIAYMPYCLYCGAAGCQDETYDQGTGLSTAVMVWLPVLHFLEFALPWAAHVTAAFLGYLVWKKQQHVMLKKK